MSRSGSKIYPYGPVLRVAPGLYTVKGKWKKSALGRRMTIVRTRDEQLAIHSAMRLRGVDMEAIDHLGRVAHILVPNRFHGSDAGWYAERYPESRVLVPRALSRNPRSYSRIDGTLEDDWPAGLGAELRRLPVKGISFHEVVFHHVESRTLILTDLAFNFTNEFEGATRLFMKWNGAVNHFGPTRLFRWLFLKDRRKLAESIREILSWDFERVIVSHGQILDNSGKEKMHRAFRFLPGM